MLSLGDGSAEERRLRIDFVEPDPKDPGGEVMLYGLSEEDPESGAWRNACLPDPDGRRLGFPLAGAFTADGRYQPAPGKLLITCTGGAEGKCVRFGYQPWGHTPDGALLAPYYQACVRMVRADYCGDGVGHTRNGTPIDLFDRIGVQRDEPAEGMTLEAAWGPEGAVCVSHTRLPDVPEPRRARRALPRAPQAVRRVDAGPSLRPVVRTVRRRPSSRRRPQSRTSSRLPKSDALTARQWTAC